MQHYEDNISARSSQTIDLLDYVHVLVQRKKLIVKITVAAAVISIVISLILPKVYSSTVKILPPSQDKSGMSMMIGQMGAGGANLASLLLGTGNQTDTYASIIESDELRDRVIDRFKLMQVYGEQYRLDAYRTMKKKITVVAGKKDGILSITVEDSDPKRSADIANALVEELEKMTVNLNMSGASQNRSFVEERLKKAQADLAKAEDNLKTFQAKNNALDLSEQSKGTIKSVAELMGQLAVQEVQLATLRASFTESSQEIKSVKASIASLKRQISLLEGTGTGNGAIPSLGSVPGLGKEYVRLMREFKIQETLVELFIKQYEMLKFTEANNVSNIQIIQKAKMPDKRIKPERAKIVILSTVSAFFVSVLLAFIMDYFAGIHCEKREALKQSVSKLFSLKDSI